jgi:hypothetical protein
MLSRWRDALGGRWDRSQLAGTRRVSEKLLKADTAANPRTGLVDAIVATVYIILEQVPLARSHLGWAAGDWGGKFPASASCGSA